MNITFYYQCCFQHKSKTQPHSSYYEEHQLFQPKPVQVNSLLLVYAGGGIIPAPEVLWTPHGEGTVCSQS